MNKKPYLCAMKSQVSAFCVAILLVLAACGTTRKSQREAGPDSLPLRQDAAETVSRATPEAGGEGQGAAVEVGAASLARRLDSLLLTADTLLRMTQLGLNIVDLTTGQALYGHNPLHRMRPASTEKVVTAIAALDCLGPGHTLDTQLLTTAAVKGHTLQGDIYIKGVMDPLFTAADARSLAAQLKAAGITRIQGRLLADASFKDGDEYGWGWCWDDENPVLSPLLVGGKPGLAAAMRTAMNRAGITLAKGIASGTAPSTARCLATVRRPLTEVLRPMLKESDNLCAEAVFYQITKRPNPSRSGGERLAQGKHYSRKQAVEVINEVISRAYENEYTAPALPTLTGGVGGGSSVADGSGLSLYNYQSAATFTRLLAYAAARPDSIYLPLTEALPIAAVDGTLKNRMAASPAADNVRAKTGSVSAVSTLVGYTTQRSTGHLIAFAILNNGLPRMAEGRALQDQICILLSQ